ncbi:MAG: cyanophycin synthetase [Actinomycetota bacterium]|nr:cyanophycin synthetase [Actinomycetota bacterium]MDH5224057.1 cyanophycin synthetase [Actinomycetota bacterium]
MTAKGSPKSKRAKRKPVPGAPPAEPDLQILQTQVFRGPNYFSYDPAIRLVVDLGSLESWPSNTIPRFNEQLLELLPRVGEHSCSRGHAGGFRERLEEGTWAGHVAEHIAIELQRESGAQVYRGKTRGTGTPGQYNVTFGYWEEQVGLAAGRLAVRLVNHLVKVEKDFDFSRELERLILLAERRAFGPSTQAILDEAASRDVPYIRLNDQSLVQLGQGKYQQRIRATMTSHTSALAVDIAGDKQLTRQLLESAGLPVPPGKIVRSADDAVEVAKRIGFPVVVKPLDGNHGRGVGLDLTSMRAVRGAFSRALKQSRGGWVVVEGMMTGRDYRLLVIGGQMVAVAERVPAHVIGDGEHSVVELVETANSDPRRGIGHEKVLTRIRIDEVAEALVCSQGFDLDDVPDADAMVKLAATGNMSTGGSAIDRTWEAHEDNVEIAEEAARVVGLDVAGIDFIAPDITVPVRETGGAIVEVNAAPGFRMHTHPTEGEPQYVARPVIDLLFPAGTPSRIPIVAVTGSNGKTTTVRMIAHVMKNMGRKVGLTSTDGVYIDGRLTKRVDASGPRSAQTVLQNPRVDFAVFEVARGGILREGLGYGRNDVAVVLNVTGDHLGLRDIDTIEQLAAVKRVIVEAVPRDGYAVLNADDELVLEMRKHCSGNVILFTMNEHHELIERWVRRGRKAVVLQRDPGGELIVLRDGRRSMPVGYTHQFPSTFDGRARMNVQNLLAAVAAAHVSGAHLHDIRHGLRTFTTDFFQAPGRLNLVELTGVTVLLDYAHNAAGLRMVGDFVERMTSEPPPSHPSAPSWSANLRVAVVATAGDRRDEDMLELGRVAARYFDEVIVREDVHTRGRERGETGSLVMQGIDEARREGARVGHAELVTDELEACRSALDRSRPGDLVVLCVDRASDVWDEIEIRRSAAR